MFEKLSMFYDKLFISWTVHVSETHKKRTKLKYHIVLQGTQSY